MIPRPMPMPMIQQKSPTMPLRDLPDVAAEVFKGMVGLPHCYSLHNQTGCTIKVLASEDPEGLITLFNAGLNIRGGGILGAGVGGQVKGVRAGARAPSDYTLQPHLPETEIRASSSPIFLLAAFCENGKFKFLFTNRRVEAGYHLHFQDRHYEDKTELWYPAKTIEEALHLRSQITGKQQLQFMEPAEAGGQLLNCMPAVAVPRQAIPTSQEEDGAISLGGCGRFLKERPKSIIQSIPPEFLKMDQLKIWSNTFKTYCDARILGIAASNGLDNNGRPFVPGSVFVEFYAPDGSQSSKVVGPHELGSVLRDRAAM